MENRIIITWTDAEEGAYPAPDLAIEIQGFKDSEIWKIESAIKYAARAIESLNFHPKISLITPTKEEQDAG